MGLRQPNTRAIAIGVAGTLLGLALLAGIAHLPPVRAYVLQQALQRLEAYGIDARARALDYDLFTLDFRIHDLRLAARGHEAVPFFTAADVHVDLPWSALTGALALQAIDIRHPRVTIVRTADGATNLPSWAGTGTAPGPTAIPVGELSVQDLRASYTDAANGITAAVDRLSVALSPAGGGIGGPIALASPISLQWEGHRTSITSLTGRLAYDGSSLALDQLRIVSAEGSLQIDGRIASLFHEPRLALRSAARLELGPLSPWLRLGPAASGRLALEATVNGPAGAPAMAVSVNGRGLGWARFRNVSVTMAADATRQSADIRSLHVEAAGGTIDGRGRIAFGGPGAGGDAHVQWRHVEAARLLAALPASAPYRLVSSLDGQIDATWTRLRPSAVSLSLTGTSRAPRATANGLTGTLALDARGGRWRLAVDQRLGPAVRVRGSAGGRVQDVLGRSDLAGRLTLGVDDLAAAWRTAAATGLAAGRTAAPLTGAARAEVTLAGTIGAPAFRGQMEATGLRADGLGPAQVTATLSGSQRQARLEALEATLGRSVLRASGGMDFRSRQVTGQVDASMADLSSLAAALPAAVQPAGSLTAHGTLSGRWPQPRIEATVAGSALQVAGQPFDRLSAGLRFDRGLLTADRVELTQGGGRVALTGHYDVARETYAVQATGRGLRLHPVPSAGGALPIDAQLDFMLDGSGTLHDPRGRGRVDLLHLSIAGTRLGAVHAEVEAANHVVALRAQMPDVSTSATARLALAPFGAFTADAHVAPADLGAWLARLPHPPPAEVTGALAADVTARGDLSRPETIAAAVDLQRLDGRISTVPIQLASPARVAWANRTIDVRHLDLRIGRVRLAVHGSLGAPSGSALDATLAGPLADLNPLVDLLRAETGGGAAFPVVEGQLSLALHASGLLAHPAVSGELALSDGRVTMAGLPPVTGVGARASYRDGVLTLSQADARWQEVAFTASGRIPARALHGLVPQSYLDALPPAASGAARLTAGITNVTPAVLAPYVGASTLAQLQGRMDGTLELTADAPALDRVSGTLTLQRADLTLAGVPFRQQQPTRLVLQDGRLQVAALDWGDTTRAGGNRIAVRGDVALGKAPALNLDVDGNLDLRVISTFTPGLGTAGHARLNAHIGGTPGAPSLTGRIQVAGAELRHADPALIVTGLSGPITLAPDRITIDGLAGQANGGTVHLSGSLTYTGLQPDRGTIGLTGRGMAFDISGLQTEVNSDLQVGLAGGRLALTGTMTIVRGAYRRPFTLAGGLLAVLQQQGLTETSGTPSMLDAMTLNVKVATADDLEVDNNYAQLAVGADLQLTGTVARPGLTGRAAVREGGEIFLGGNTYRIRGTGSVDFLNPTAIEPDLDISAVTRVSTYDITLGISGTPERLTTSLTSSPPLGESDLVSLLLTGQTLQPGSPALAAVGTTQLLGYLSGEFLGVAGRAVGLDTLRIQRGLPNVSFDPSLIAGETDPSSRLTFGKHVTQDLELIFSQDLSQTGGLTWIVSYMPRRMIDLRVTSLDNGIRRYDFMQELTAMGPPAASVGAGVAARPVRVAAVRFTGRPGFPGTTLAHRIKLKRGDLFVFSRWQDDRDRLLRFYQAQGYWEARVRATRAAGGAPAVAQGPATAPETVTLDYRIDRGPRTTLDIEGYRLPSSVRRRMERAWTQSVFDDFLLGQLTSIARAYLAGRGYLRAAVTAGVAPGASASAKRITVSIQEGPRTKSRRVVFLGNARIPGSRLSDLVDDEGLSERAWVDPAALQQAVLALYHRLGMLAAEVSVGAPRFADGTAELPVAITEGPVFRIVQIRFTGLHAKTGTAALEALGLPIGGAYSAVGVQQAIGRLEASYRADGFNAERATVDASLQRQTGRVSLDVHVDEGPQQILQGIVATGARHASPVLVSRALALTPGTPVDLTAWARARRRLYETGLFRNVDIQAVPVPSSSPAPASATGVSTQPVQAKVTLDEWPPLRFRYGFQVQDEPGTVSSGRAFLPGIAGDLAYNNLFGRAVTTGVAGQYTKDYRAARSYLTAPSLFGLPITSSLYVSRSRQVLTPSAAQPFITADTTITGEQLFRPLAHVTASYSYTFDRNHTYDLHPDPMNPFPFDLTVNIARLTTTALYDTRNDLVDATRGLFSAASLEYSAPGLGSDLNFIKYLFQQRYYHPLPGGTVFATNLRLGMAEGFGQGIIPSEKFYAGGGNSVRGYAQDSLGPKDFFGDPTGGNALLVLNEELRFPIAWIVRGVGFFDAGNVFPRIGSLSLLNLDTSVGVGVRIYTPFALLRVDYGIPLGQPPGLPFGRWVFSIGQAF